MEHLSLRYLLRLALQSAHCAPARVLSDQHLSLADHLFLPRLRLVHLPAAVYYILLLLLLHLLLLLLLHLNRVVHCHLVKLRRRPVP